MRPSRASRLASCAQKIATTLRRPFPSRRFGSLQAALFLCLLAGAGGILLWGIPDRREPAPHSAGPGDESVGVTVAAPHLKARRGASSDFAVDTWEDVDAASNKGTAPSLLRWLPLIHRGKDQSQVTTLVSSKDTDMNTSLCLQSPFLQTVSDWLHLGFCEDIK